MGRSVLGLLFPARTRQLTPQVSRKRSRFLRRSLLVGAFALFVASVSFAARADAATSPQLDFTGSSAAANAQAVSPDVAEWTSHLIITSPSAHHHSINRLTGGILARTSRIAQELTRSAMRFLGVPYVFGGTSTSGFDCSGFVQHVFAGLGIGLPRTADAQYDYGRPAVGGPQSGRLGVLRYLRRRLARRHLPGQGPVRACQFEPRRDGQPSVGLVLGGAVRRRPADGRNPHQVAVTAGPYQGHCPPGDNSASRLGYHKQG